MFKVGDRVVVLDGVEIGSPNGVWFNPNMSKHIGREYVVDYFVDAALVKLVPPEGEPLDGVWEWVFDPVWLTPAEDYHCLLEDDTEMLDGMFSELC